MQSQSITLPPDARPIPDYPDYYADRLGHIWRTYHDGRPPQLAHNWTDARGYRRAHMGPTGRNGGCYIHQLVLSAYCGARPPGYETRHLDGDRLNNRLDNLAWGTAAENSADTYRHGRKPCGEAHPYARLTDAAVMQILQASSAGQSTRQLARLFGVTGRTVRDVLQGKSWKHVPRP